MNEQRNQPQRLELHPDVPPPAGSPHAPDEEEKELPPTGIFAWLARMAPTPLILAVLGGLAYWGHHTGWTLSPADGTSATGHAKGTDTLFEPVCVPYPPRGLRFVSTEAMDKLGIVVEPVWWGEMIEGVPATGEIIYDPTRVAHIAARVPGRVRQVFKAVGDPVARGDLVALVDAAEVGKAKAELRQAFEQVRYLAGKAEDLRRASNALPGRTLQEADANLREARIRLSAAEQTLVNLGLFIRSADLERLSSEELTQRLQTFGLPEAIIRQPTAAGNVANLLPVRAPLDGVVVEQPAVEGQEVDPKKVLVVVADNRQMWLNLAVHSEQAGAVARGQWVQFRPDGSRKEVTGVIRWLGTAVDPNTRTVEVRVELPNVDGRLRANTFGTGTIILRQEKKAIVVPNAAVQRDGTAAIVFIQDKDFFKPGAPKVFHAREVRLGARNEQNTEILAGVQPEENVVTKGSDILRTELLKNDRPPGAGSQR